MSQSETRPIRNGIIASVVGGIILLFLEPISGWVGNIFKTIAQWILNIWKMINTSYLLSGWIVLLLIFLSAPTIFDILKSILRDNQPEYKKSLALQ